MAKDLLTKLYDATEGHKEILVSHLEEYNAEPSDYPAIVTMLLQEVQRADIRHSLLKYSKELNV
jgi:hypothetical protein